MFAYQVASLALCPLSVASPPAPHHHHASLKTLLFHKPWIYIIASVDSLSLARIPVDSNHITPFQMILFHSCYSKILGVNTVQVILLKHKTGDMTSVIYFDQLCIDHFKCCRKYCKSEFTEIICHSKIWTWLEILFFFQKDCIGEVSGPLPLYQTWSLIVSNLIT